MIKVEDTTDDTHPWRIIVLDGIIQFRRGQKPNGKENSIMYANIHEKTTP